MSTIQQSEMLFLKNFRFIQVRDFWSENMNLRLKNKYLIKILFLSSAILFLVLSLFFIPRQRVWNEYDYKILDFYYKQAVTYGYGPKPAFKPKIVYLTLTDTSYNFFGKNFLDRSDMAKVNFALGELNPEGVIYDIIFVRESSADADHNFLQSLNSLDAIYMPMALELSNMPVNFRQEDDQSYEALRSGGFSPAQEKGESNPYHAKRALLQFKGFGDAATASGAISAIADADSVYRHNPILIKVDDFYYPSLSFSIFLDWANVSLDEITIEWGEKIVVPATRDSFLETDVVIPIDDKGNVFVPFVNSMGNDFKIMTIHAFLNYYSDLDLRGNLLDFFEGNFVLIADIATGTSDLGDTPLEDQGCLVSIHASILNGLLSNTFYTPWPFSQVMVILAIIFILLVSASFLQSSWIFI